VSTPSEGAVPGERPDAAEPAAREPVTSKSPDAGEPAVRQGVTAMQPDAGEPAVREPAQPTGPAASVPLTTTGAAAGAAASPTEPVPPAAAESDSVLPGAHRGGFQRLPTAPVPITSESAPPDPDGEQPEPVMQWIMPPPAPPARGMAGWALAFAVLALIVSLFVGWGFALGIVAIVAAILALRRPLESRAVAVWAIVLGGLSIVYSAGWLVFAGMTAGLFG
jgi:hypothetical protein